VIEFLGIFADWIRYDIHRRGLQNVSGLMIEIGPRITVVGLLYLRVSFTFSLLSIDSYQPSSAS
jgi:hypothetical protein